MRAGTDTLTRVSPWIAVGAALLYYLYDRFALGGSLPLIACCAALAVAGTLLRWRDIMHVPADATFEAPRRALRATAVLLPASIALAVLYALLGDGPALRSAIVSALIPVLLGWSIFFFLPMARPTDRRADTPRIVAPARIVAGFVAVTIAVLAVRMYVGDHWASIDEVIYSLQAHLFVQGDYYWHLDEAAQRFFTLPLMVAAPEGPYSQYTPGYPAVIAAFLTLGAPWMSGAALGAIAVGSTYMLGRRCASPFVGIVAAALLTTHVLFLELASRYLSHVAAMTAIVTAAWLLLSSPSASQRRRVVECVLAGLLIGIAVTIRPVTGIALGLSLWLWLVVSRGWRATRDTTLLLALGMVIPAIAMLLYDSRTNGAPLRLGYTAAQGHLNDIGFGTRGVMVFDAHGQRVPSTQTFTLLDAMRYEVQGVLWPLMRDLTPLFSVLPVIAAAYAYRLKPRWVTTAAFAALPLINFVYFGNSERLYLELLPFALVAVALIVARVWESDVVAGRALATFLIGASVVSSATNVAAAERERVRHPTDGVVLTRELIAAQRTSGPMLVFVRNPPLSEPLFIALSALNFGRFPGRVVVARDLGRENVHLVCRMPGRIVVIAESATKDHGARLLPVRPDSSAGMTCGAPALSTLTRIHG